MFKLIIFIFIYIFNVKDLVLSECRDLNGRRIAQGIHYVPGPDACTLCVCDSGSPKWCKAVLCTPPQDCKSFRLGSSCCEFICLDDTLSKADGFDFESNSDLGLRLIASAVMAILSLSLLFFLIHRIHQRKVRNRQNCHVSEEDRSLGGIGYIGGSIGYLQGNIGYMGSGNNDPIEFRYDEPTSHFPFWKPQGNYFSRGEAPPPYEEAVAAARAESVFLSNNTSIAVLPDHQTNFPGSNFQNVQSVPNAISYSTPYLNQNSIVDTTIAHISNRNESTTNNRSRNFQQDAQRCSNRPDYVNSNNSNNISTTYRIEISTSNRNDILINELALNPALTDELSRPQRMITAYNTNNDSLSNLPKENNLTTRENTYNNEMPAIISREESFNKPELTHRENNVLNKNLKETTSSLPLRNTFNNNSSRVMGKEVFYKNTNSNSLSIFRENDASVIRNEPIREEPKPMKQNIVIENNLQSSNYNSMEVEGLLHHRSIPKNVSLNTNYKLDNARKNLTFKSNASCYDHRQRNLCDKNKLSTKQHSTLPKRKISTTPTETSPSIIYSNISHPQSFTSHAINNRLIANKLITGANKEKCLMHTNHLPNCKHKSESFNTHKSIVTRQQNLTSSLSTTGLNKSPKISHFKNDKIRLTPNELMFRGSCYNISSSGSVATSLSSNCSNLSTEILITTTRTPQNQYNNSLQYSNSTSAINISLPTSPVPPPIVFGNIMTPSIENNQNFQKFDDNSHRTSSILYKKEHLKNAHSTGNILSESSELKFAPMVQTNFESSLDGSYQCLHDQQTFNDEEDYRSECENCKSAHGSRYYLVENNESQGDSQNETMTLQRKLLDFSSKETLIGSHNYRTSLTLPINTKKQHRLSTETRDTWVNNMHVSSSEEDN